jgi:hypothetical protein
VEAGGIEPTVRKQVFRSFYVRIFRFLFNLWDLPETE